MIEILMQLADIGSTVTVVVTKKEDNYLISVTPKVASQNLQPVLISGKKEDILADFDKVLTGMKQMKASISNISDINKKLEEKVKEKATPAATAKTEKADKKKGPLKVGSGTTVTKGADLFGASAEVVEETTTEPEEDEEELTDEEVNAEPEQEPQSNVPEPPPAVIEKPIVEPNEEEEIF